MASAAALFCCTAVLLVLQSSASDDEHIWEQREISFDEFIQEMKKEPAVMQRELDFADFPGQVLVTPRHHEGINDGGRPGFGPRSFGGPPSLDYPVQFPLGRPTADNLQAICLNGDRRPRYPESYFPASGFGWLKRQASAVNKAESWFSTCCKGNRTEETLCCATQAWELFIEYFCAEAASIKQSIYHCCKVTGNDRQICFQNEAPNPNYEATEALSVPTIPPVPCTDVFFFDPSACPSTERPAAPRKAHASFPPGRPTSDTIETLCRKEKRRPIITRTCHTTARLGRLARQANTVDQIETAFKYCCKSRGPALDCADRRWREELDQYCVDRDGGPVDFRCCSSDVPDDRYRCFQDASPDRPSNMTSATEEPSLHNICDIHKILSKKLPAGFPLKRFVNQCCPLSTENKTACFQQKLEEVSEMCSSRPRRISNSAFRRCCRTSSPEPVQCLSRILMDAISKATNVSRQK